MNTLKIGVLGAWRGMHVANDFRLLNCDIVALCDSHKERREAAAAKINNNIAQYDDFDEFLNHDMDAVIIANNCPDHTPFIIKCFEKGVHVYSECLSNGTMAEGVELAEAYEKSNSIFMLAENYPQMVFNREIKRVCDAGTLGKILYAEGEYNHPTDPRDVEFGKNYNYHPLHWRNYLPRTYYITHSIGPIMWATGATPKRVTAFAAFAPAEKDSPTASYVGDRAAIVTTLNDDGSIFRVTGCAAFGAHHNSYRVCGTEGQIENLRGMGNQVMLRYNKWSVPKGSEENNLYEAKWNDKDTSDNIALVDSYYCSIGHSPERIDLLLALECFKISDQQLDKDEFIYCEAINLEEFEYLLNNNYIMDANARIGYYRYLEYLMKEGY